MKFGKQILSRIGLSARKKEQAPDVFDLRLQRLGRREAQLILRRALFKQLLQPVAA